VPGSVRNIVLASAQALAAAQGPGAPARRARKVRTGAATSRNILVEGTPDLPQAGGPRRRPASGIGPFRSLPDLRKSMSRNRAVARSTLARRRAKYVCLFLNSPHPSMLPISKRRSRSHGMGTGIITRPT